MSDFLKLAKNRKTTYIFTDKPVKRGDVIKILEAGRWAPSVHNLQPWYFIIIKGPKTIDSLLSHCYYGQFHTMPKVIIALVLDAKYYSSKDLRGVTSDKAGTYEALMSVAMAGLNMVYEAEKLGIDSCFLTPEADYASKLLKIDKFDFIPLMVALGYGDKKLNNQSRDRRQINDLIHYEYRGGKIEPECT